MVLFMLLLPNVSPAQEITSLFGMSRRRPPFHYTYSYLFYPIVTSIEPFGTAYGGGGTLIDMFDTDTHFLK